MCLCFGLGPALKVFTKLLKIPISEKDQYQSDNIFGRYIDFESHNTTGSHEPRLSHAIYLLQNVGFIINIKKAILHSCQKIEILGMEIDSVKMILSLTPEN